MMDKRKEKTEQKQIIKGLEHLKKNWARHQTARSSKGNMTQTHNSINQAPQKTLENQPQHQNSIKPAIAAAINPRQKIM